MKRGFTLIEFLAVVVLITLITLLVVPKLLNLQIGSKDKSDKLVEDMIYKATELYISDNPFYKKVLSNKYCVTVKQLVDKDYLKNPKINDEDITEIKSVQITYNKGFKYELVDKEDCVEEMPHSVLAYGSIFNSKIKTLVSGTTKTYSDADTLVKSIEFNSNTNIPALPEENIVDLSDNNDKSIIGYWDSTNSKVTVYSENLVEFSIYSSEMFWNFKSLENIDFNIVDTSKVVTMMGMFKNCVNLKAVDLSSFDTSNVINMQAMFYGCTNLPSIDLSSFNTSKVTIMDLMF